MSNNDFYVGLAADYDRMILWERRLKTERPWFDGLWSRFGTRSVLDASCGTGHHLVMFAGMGLDVWGSDASGEMIRLARQTARSAGLHMDERICHCDWNDLTKTMPRLFDAVLCIGNSLPYVIEHEMLAASLAGMWSRVADGGFLLLQFKNYLKLYSTRQRFLPLSSSSEPYESVALRMCEYHPDMVDFHVILLDKRGGGWSLRHQSTPLKPYTPEDIAPLLHSLGAQTALHGALSLAPFDPGVSEDIVMLALKLPEIAQGGRE
ncbi:MAG: class I SAM-dependent methyltransferase [bacterium]